MRMLRRREWGGGDLTDALLGAAEGHQSGVWTAMPARVDRFYADRSAVDCEVLVQAVFADETGAERTYTLPLLVDVPVQFPRGGGFVLTFPLAPGDEGLVVFASRCIDAWWQSGGVQPPAELRMHDLSDGFFLAGVRSLPMVEAGISGTAAELRAVDPAGPRVSLTPAGAVTVTAATINLNGALVINGEPYDAHRHSGVAVGAGVTGGRAP